MNPLYAGDKSNNLSSASESPREIDGDQRKKSECPGKLYSILPTTRGNDKILIENELTTNKTTRRPHTPIACETVRNPCPGIRSVLILKDDIGVRKS